MSRGWLIVIGLAAAIALLYFWLIPALKDKFLGHSMEVQCKILSAVDGSVPYKGEETVPRTIVNMELDFPMGSAPESINELVITGDDGKAIDVNWPPDPISSDMPNERVTKWVLKEVYFPYGWRVGTLRKKIQAQSGEFYTDLCTIKLSNVQTETDRTR